MPRYLLECVISLDRLETMAAARAAHYEFLIANQYRILFGGPARLRSDGPPQSMVMVIEAASEDAAIEFISSEPYNRLGAFSSVSVRCWTQVIPEPSPGTLQSTLESEQRRQSGQTPS
ncbi:YciI family protein [Mycobacterium sp. M26]|uniref:YciI family protein n=1 Tax=Mycobacterium sp. M26 TaxID=1762962 RepID=UPI00073ED4E5|nr:YciI family protein [Mycobacterium sp. M26]